MSRIATARKLANEIWFNTEAMTDRAAWESFTTTQSIGYPLAQAIVKGWVTGISIEGVTQLCETVRDLRNLLKLAALPQVDVTSEEVKPVTLVRNGITWTLMFNGAPLPLDETIVDDGGDEFVITGAEWNPLMDVREPVLVGYWPSIGQDAADAGGVHASVFPDVRWTWLANN